MRLDELVNTRVLLLLIDPTEPAQQALLLGTARVSAAGLEIAGGERGPTIQVPGAIVDRDGFAPAALPHLIGPPDQLARARALAQEVAWCVPLLTPDWPPGVELAPGFLAGVARGSDGRVLLMQVR
jgi:hypothetical protein